MWHGGPQHAVVRRRSWCRCGSSCALVVGCGADPARRGAGAWRTIFYLPALVPPVAATIAFVFLFNPATGPVNKILELFGIDGPLWFNDPAWAKPSLVLLGLWVLGDIMIIFLAGLLDVPAEQYEAAALDGAERGAAVLGTSRCPICRRCCCSRWSPG